MAKSNLPRRRLAKSRPVPHCPWTAPQDFAQWNTWLAAGLHGRNRWRLGIVFLGMLFAGGRRTVTSWLRAAGVADDYHDYSYFLAALGHKTTLVAEQLLRLLFRHLPLGERLLIVIDDSPTKRYGPQVEGADLHHNPTPGPSQAPFVYGHNWVTLSLLAAHLLWGAIALPLQAALYVRQKTVPLLPAKWNWKFATKELVDGSASTWDDSTRRPSHADRRKALRQACLPKEFLADKGGEPVPRKIIQLAKQLLQLTV